MPICGPIFWTRNCRNSKYPDIGAGACTRDYRILGTVGMFNGSLLEMVAVKMAELGMK